MYVIGVQAGGWGMKGSVPGQPEINTGRAS